MNEQVFIKHVSDTGATIGSQNRNNRTLMEFTG